MKVLCISGSPIKNGNTAQFINRAVEPLTDSEIEVEVVQLAKLKISDCIHCNWCMKNKEPNRICIQEDDAEPVLEKIRDSDLLVVASPAYYGRMTGLLASLLDRTRPFIFSKPYRGCMADKPGVALAVSWGRNTGNETTMQSIIWSFMVLEMLPVGHHHSGAIYGGGGISNPALVHAESDDKHAINSDVVGILSAQGAVKRAVNLARRLGK